MQAKLPYLATYLGHVSAASTHHYLKLTPELGRAAGERFHQRFAPLWTAGGIAWKPPKPSTLALALKSFFMDYVPRQRALSPLTLQSYRDSLKLLLQYTAGEKGDASQLTVEQLSVAQVTAFLQSLETTRENQISTRNVRLSAIHSFFRYLGGQYPEHLEQAQRILNIPFKRTGTRQIEHLESEEIQDVLKCAN